MSDGVDSSVAPSLQAAQAELQRSQLEVMRYVVCGRVTNFA